MKATTYNIFRCNWSRDAIALCVIYLYGERAQFPDVCCTSFFFLNKKIKAIKSVFKVRIYAAHAQRSHHTAQTNQL